MSDIPSFLQDAKDLLSKDGFATTDVWYHGTSSALVESIEKEGLKRSGDKALKQVAKSTMATIGNKYTESIEPVFLTQSREIAYYWAEQTVRERSVRFEGKETPVVFSVNLPKPYLAKVKPDVGAASLLLLKEGERFMEFIAGVFESNGFDIPDVDLMNADRMEYLNKLGMAYIDQDVDSKFISVVSC